MWRIIFILTNDVSGQWVLCFLAQHNSKLLRIENALSQIEEVGVAPANCHLR